MTTATAVRFRPNMAGLSDLCQFVGFLPDGGNVLVCHSSIILDSEPGDSSIIILDSEEPGDYSSMPLDVCIDCLPAESRLHQAALLYLEGPTPTDSVSGMTPTNTGATEMQKATIVRRTTIIETYIEITPARQPEPATVKARVVEPASIPAPSAAPVYGIGDRVRYTSKAGRTATYTVKWVGLAKDGQTQRIGLRLPGKRDLFFVNVDRNVTPA